MFFQAISGSHVIMPQARLFSPSVTLAQPLEHGYASASAPAPDNYFPQQPTLPSTEASSLPEISGRKGRSRRTKSSNKSASSAKRFNPLDSSRRPNHTNTTFVAPGSQEHKVLLQTKNLFVVLAFAEGLFFHYPDSPSSAKFLDIAKKALTDTSDAIGCMYLIPEFSSHSANTTQFRPHGNHD